MRIRVLAGAALAALAVISACGTGQQQPATPAIGAPSVSSSPSARPSPTQRLLAFLVLDASQSATVEWVTLTGDVVAKATFTTPKLSAWTNAASLLQPDARVAGGGSIFYVDSQGAIRSLAPNGSVKMATSLALRSGQNVVSFAVSPDGQRIAASILNYPPQHSPPPNSISDPLLEPGDWWYDYQTATAGQSAQRVVSRDLGTFPNLGQPTGITTVIGWDQGGPVAISDTRLSAQDPPLSVITPGKALVHLGPDGSHLDQIGGAGCIPLDWNAQGNVVCYTSSSPRTPEGCVTRYVVNSPAGATLWSASSGNQCVFDPRLSPASDRFCTDAGTVYNQSGTLTKLVQSNSTQADACQGWLDDSTVVSMGASAGGSSQVYTIDLTSQTRTNVMTASRRAVYLGSVGGGS